MWIFSKIVLSSTLFLVLFNEAVLGARLDKYSEHRNKRPNVKPRRRQNGLASVIDCADWCERLSSIRCTMFAVRKQKKGMRCNMYSDSDTKRINLLDELLDDVAGFVTFRLEEGAAPVVADDSTGCIEDGDTNGVLYRGKQTTTSSGRACQRWIKDKPHRPTYRPINAARHRNYCRNPDRDPDGPWCYTTDRKKRWEYCSIPACSDVRPGTTTTEATLRTTPTRTTPRRTRPSRRTTTPRITFPPPTSRRPPPPTTPRTPPPPSTPRTPPTPLTPTPEPVPEPCFVCNGDSYRGSMSQTASGKTCQSWNASAPHQHSNHPYQKPDRNLDENYCRNPDGDVKPWCYTMDPNTRWEYCGARRCTTPDGSTFIPRVDYTTGCSIGSGANYRGNVARTRSGKTCAPWIDQAPHKHSRTPENYPCSGLDSNFCRNPSSNFDLGPWCYTTDPSTRWEMCDIPKCGPDGRPTTTTTTTTPRTTTPRPTPARRSTTAAPKTCGNQAISPSFITQAFNIVDDRIVPTGRRKRSSGQTERIIGGDFAIHGSWPWSSSIRYWDVHFCGGTLIKPSWVLTASHCVDDNSNPEYMSVKVGHFMGSEAEMQMRTVKRYILHESYSKKNVRNDIALIQLNSPFTLNDYVATACLPNPEYIVPGDSYCVVTGWGNTFDPKYENQLKQAVLPVHSYSDCLRYMGSHMVDRTQMCAGYKGKGHDTCRGDSGGPLACLNNNHWTVQGVTSWGSGCEDKKGSYGSYTRVSKYIDWIAGKIAKYSRKVLRPAAHQISEERYVPIWQE